MKTSVNAQDIKPTRAEVPDSPGPRCPAQILGLPKRLSATRGALADVWESPPSLHQLDLLGGPSR